MLGRLFQQIARPFAAPDTPGAFLFGLRVMALDGTVDVLADTPANGAFFGRACSDRGPSAFPQVRSTYLAECGTHAIVDAEFMPYQMSERVGGLKLLRSIQPGMLLLWDRGFLSFELILAVLQQGAQVLERLPAHVQPRIQRRLAAGSQLAWLVAPASSPAKHAPPIAVRIIEYTLTDPALPGLRAASSGVDDPARPATNQIVQTGRRAYLNSIAASRNTVQISRLRPHREHREHREPPRVFANLRVFALSSRLI